MLKIEVHPDAYNELEKTKFWYENQAKDLGTDFFAEIERGVENIQRLPDTWPRYFGTTRRFLLRRFPFGIIYRHDKNKIQIFAIMHTYRNPGYWKNRKF